MQDKYDILEFRTPGQVVAVSKSMEIKGIVADKDGMYGKYIT